MKLAVSLLGLLLVSSAYASTSCPTYREAKKIWGRGYLNWYYSENYRKRCWGVKPKRASTPKTASPIFLPVVSLLEPEVIKRWPDPEPEPESPIVYSTFKGPIPDVWPNLEELNKRPSLSYLWLAILCGVLYVIGEFLFTMKQSGRIT